MASNTFNGGSNFGTAYGSNAAYATARSTGSSTIAGEARAGQRLNTGVYQVYCGLLEFDTSSIPAGATVTSWTLRPYIFQNDSVQDFTLEAYISDYGASITSADFVAGGSLSGLTKVATLAITTQDDTQLTMTTIDPAVGITVNGITRFLLSSDRVAANTTPTVHEYVSLDCDNTYGTPSLLDVTWTVAGGSRPANRRSLLGIF